MKTKILGLFLTASCAFYAAAIYADDMPGGPPPEAAPSANLFSGNVQFMTNYVGRGLAQSLGNPSVEGEIDVNSGDGLYGGIDGNSINWIDQLYPGDDVGVEIDAWAGWRQHFGADWVTKAGFLRLQFPGNYVPQTPPVAEPNTTEAFGYVAWKNYSARLNYSVTESFGTPDTKGSIYLDLNGSQDLGNNWTLAEHLGRNQKTGHDPVSGLSHSVNDYTDYKLAITYAFPENVSLTLAHTWTNADPLRYTLYGYVVGGRQLNGYFVGGHHTWLLLEKDF